MENTGVGALELNELLCELKAGLKNIFGRELREIIVYGSYARGKSDEESDLDIMVLVDMEDEEIKKKREKVLDLTVDLTTRYGIVLSVIENNYDYFYDWVKALPFFTNVIKEGVNIYG